MSGDSRGSKLLLMSSLTSLVLLFTALRPSSLMLMTFLCRPPINSPNPLFIMTSSLKVLNLSNSSKIESNFTGSFMARQPEIFILISRATSAGRESLHSSALGISIVLEYSGAGAAAEEGAREGSSKGGIEDG